MWIAGPSDVAFREEMDASSPNLRRVFYSAPMPGEYEVRVNWGGVEALSSPFRVLLAGPEVCVRVCRSAILPSLQLQPFELN